VPTQINGSAGRPTRRKMSGLTPKNPVKKSEPIQNGNVLPEQTNGHLSPYARVQKTWRDFSRSPSPLGLIPLHRHYRYLIHKHEIPRKALHVSIGFMTLRFYTHGIQATAITPWLLGALIPIASVDLLRHRFPEFNRFYVRCLGALMRETEVDGYNGVIWYLLGALIALQLYPKDIGVMSVLLLSWCDTAASTFGRLYGRYTIRLRRGKSLAGTLAAFATGIITAVMFWGWLAPRTGTFPDDPPNGFMFQGQLGLPIAATRYLGWNDGSATISGGVALAVMSIATGFIASVSEFIDILGWDDNLTIPVLSSMGLWAVLKAFGQ
jgi:diacylglycerol kinase (CTP)